MTIKKIGFFQNFASALLGHTYTSRFFNFSGSRFKKIELISNYINHLKLQVSIPPSRVILNVILHNTIATKFFCYFYTLHFSKKIHVPLHNKEKFCIPSMMHSYVYHWKDTIKCSFTWFLDLEILKNCYPSGARVSGCLFLLEKSIISPVCRPLLREGVALKDEWKKSA